MAFNLGDILVNIKANTDGLKKGMGDVQIMGEQTKGLGDKIQSGMRVAAAGLAVVGAGLTLYAKNATDYTKQLVAQSIALGREIGVSATEASRLTAALQRMGIDADSAQQMFGIFAKQISKATEASGANSLATQKLQIDIEKTKQEIAVTTDEINRHGDANGSLNLKLRELNNTLAQQEQQLGTSANAFQKLGVNVLDAQGKQKGFTQILGEVADKFKAMPDGIDKTALSMQLFGRSGKDMIKVLDLGSQGIADLEAQADKLGLTLTPGTIDKIRALIQSQKDLKQETDALKISVGTATAPVLTDFNKKLSQTTQLLLNAHEPIKSLATNVLAFGGPVATATSGLISFLGNLSSIGPVVAKIVLAMGIFVVVAAALGAIGFEIYKNWATVGPVLQSIGQQIMGVLGPAITILTVAWGYFTAAMSLVWSMLVSYLAPAFEQLWGAVQRLWAAINPAFTDLLKILAGLLGGVIVAAIFAAIGVIIALVTALSFIVSVISNVINWISNFIGWMGTAAVAVAGAIATIAQWFLMLPLHVANAINGAVSWVMSLPGRILGALGGIGGLLVGVGISIMNGLINGLSAAAGGVWGAIIGALHGAQNAAWGFWGAFVDAGWGLIRALASGIRNAANEAVNAAKDVLNRVRRLLPYSDAKEGPLSDLTLSGRRFSETFATGITRARSAVLDAVNGTLALPFGELNATIAGRAGAPALVAAAGAMVAGASTINKGTTILGDINIANRSDADYLLAKLDRNTLLESGGGSRI